MLQSLRNIWDIPDLRKRVLFTLGLLAVYRLGNHVPTPGINAKALQGVSMDDKRLKHVEAIVLSMTPEERADPTVLSGSRKLRIAKGSGRSVQEVNRLLEQFQQMRKMGKFLKRM